MLQFITAIITHEHLTTPHQSVLGNLQVTSMLHIYVFVYTKMHEHVSLRHMTIECTTLRCINDVCNCTQTAALERPLMAHNCKDGSIINIKQYNYNSEC